jgi:hypothetical protein
MGDAKRNTWLQINRRFVGTRVLHRQASMKPVGRRVNKFIPAIEKIASAVPYIVDVLPCVDRLRRFHVREIS